MKQINWVLCLIILLGLSVQKAQAEDDKKEGVKQYGVVFNMAKDRKMEQVGGIYQPEGIDKYVERKVNDISDRMEKMEAKMETMSQKLDQLSNQLSESSKNAFTKKSSK